MNNIFINAVNAKIGGGKNILDNFILQLSQIDLRDNYYILTPNYENYKQYTKRNLTVIDIAGFYKKNILFFFLYFIKFHSLLRKYKIDLIFNFSDLLIPTKKNQIYFFDWPYAVYSAKYIWNKMSLKDYLIRKSKIFLIKKYIHLPKLIIVQTKNIENRLKKQFELENITIIPTPVAIDIFNNKNKKKFNLPGDRKKYLYPANYMSHKNFDIIIPLAEKIKKLNLPFTIVLTINETVAKKFIREIYYKDLECIINIGKIDGVFMPSLYQQCDAIIFPSLLETYGLPYIEAMAHGKPILTSDLDFAHDVCGDIAYYFNPFDADSILKEMQNVFSNEQERLERIRKGKLKVQNLPDWKEVTEQFQQQIEIILNQN
jgi:glycosyltransferase involved in cell wall biosynthesis